MSEEPELVWSSGNVFADLGLKDPDLLLTKAEIATHKEWLVTWREPSVMERYRAMNPTSRRTSVTN